jgi:hypothetical protein
MAANRCKLWLYQHGMRKGQEAETNLDPRDDSRLRELLEERVRAVAGTLRLDLSAGWELHVRGPSGGTLHARVSVDKAGRTVVKR